MTQPAGSNSSRSLMIIVGSLSMAVVAAWWVNSRTDRNQPPLVERSDDQQHTNVDQSAESAIAYQPPADAHEFVGSQACAECHADYFESYQQHPMARSTRRVADADDVLNRMASNSTVDGTGHRYEVRIDHAAKSLVHRDQFFNSSGAAVLHQDVTMNWVMGSGQRAHAFLFQDAGQLFMSPLNWYAEGNRWDMAPNYSPDDRRRFDRRATDDCLHCHAGRSAVAERGSHRFQSPPFHEMAIGCERCHGAGKNHIDFHNGQSAAVDSIVNPASLAPFLRESVCYQCHLHSDARVLRTGRTHFDFRPGMSLHEIWAVFDAAETEATSRSGIESIHHVQQMRSSRCFQNSAGDFGCISCHDPHRVPDTSERLTFYNQRCGTCHETDACAEQPSRREASGDSCIGCHMPSQASENMAHVSVTDHRVLRRPVNATTPQPERETSVRLEFFANSQTEFRPAEARRLRAIATLLHMDKLGRPAPRELVHDLRTAVQQDPKDADALTALGVIASQQGRPADAATWYAQAKDLPSAAEVSLESLLNISYSRGDLPRATELADQLLQIAPRNASGLAIRADLYRLAGNGKAAISTAERCLAINPTLHPVREWLINLLQKSAADDEAARHQQLLKDLRRESVTAP